MKSERFTAGQLWIERNRRREGPPVVYTVLCGKTARPFTDPKAILKWVKWPKGTPTGDALREWLASFEQKPQTPAPELDMAKIKAEGFGPLKLMTTIQPPTLKWFDLIGNAWTRRLSATLAWPHQSDQAPCP